MHSWLACFSLGAVRLRPSYRRSSPIGPGPLLNDSFSVLQPAFVSKPRPSSGAPLPSVSSGTPARARVPPIAEPSHSRLQTAAIGQRWICLLEGVRAGLVLASVTPNEMSATFSICENHQHISRVRPKQVFAGENFLHLKDKRDECAQKW